MPNKTANNDLSINVGRLSSIPQLIAAIARPLQDFTERWRQERQTRVIWDLRNLQSGRIDIATLASFCASAQRLRAYAYSKPIAIIQHQPDILRFLAGVGFFQLVDQGDLFDFYPPGVIGSFGLPDLHPTTQIFCFRYIPEAIPDLHETVALNQWKDACRESFRIQMLYTHGCYRLSQIEELPHQLDSGMINAVLNSCAELATNAILWGRSDAFIAVQVGKRSVSAAVCDAGIGLLASLNAKNRDSISRQFNDDHQAAFYASLYNRREFGLFQAIETVLALGGCVTVASGQAELLWRPALWRKVRMRLDDLGDRLYNPDAPDALLGPVVHGKMEPEDYKQGLRRSWENGLRGTRVSFQMPYTPYNR